MMRNSKLAAFIVAAFVATVVFSPGARPAPQPVPFSVRGYVYYDNGTPADSMDVTVENLRTGQTVVEKTNADGYYKAILGGAPGSAEMVDDGDEVSVKVAEGELVASGITNLPVDAAVAGTAPAYVWVNLTLGEKVEPDDGFLFYLGVGAVGLVALLFIALGLRKGRRGEDEQAG